MNELILSYIKLDMSVQDSTQNMKEFSATYNAIKQRYHPIVWFFMNLFAQ